MRILFSSKAWAHYLHWRSADGNVQSKINDLIKECLRTPFSGTGKPEPLQGDYKGWWSRRINREHRLIYRVTGTGDEQTLEIAACRYHYG